MLLVKSYKKGVLIITSLTTIILFVVLFKSYQDLKSYMTYIVDNGRSAIFFEEYINKKIALNLINSFSIDRYDSGLAGARYDDICDKVDEVDGVRGLNLTTRSTKKLTGTLQTRNKFCNDWARDVKYLSSFNDENNYSERYSFSNFQWKIKDSNRYYIDFENEYIYINHLVDTSKYIFDHWIGLYPGAMNSGFLNIWLDSDAVEDLNSGKSVTSHIYKDSYTLKKIISMITPIFYDGKLKGVVISDIDLKDLRKSFYTADRPLLWRYLNITVIDRQTGARIIFNKISHPLLVFIKYTEDITVYYSVRLKLDAQYFIISNIFVFLIYIIITFSSCRYLKYQLSKNHYLSLENVTDSMTGLYNRKKLSSELEEKIASLMSRRVPVTIGAIDCDKLKIINDTLGHHAGDRAIISIGNAILCSIRESDYGIRLGGDEFIIILIDCNLENALNIIASIKQRLRDFDEDGIVSFSFGCYQMVSGDSLASAQIAADELLYEHKKNKQDAD